jgi:plasmid stabilization system protein ParE
VPKLIWSDDAIRDVGRLRRFLAPKNPAAAARAAGTIRRAVRILADQPGVGRPVEELPERFRELVIPFGDGGYLARYELVGEAVVVVAVRHQNEAGYG